MHANLLMHIFLENSVEVLVALGGRSQQWGTCYQTPRQVLSLTSPATGRGGSILQTPALESDFSSLLVYLMVEWPTPSPPDHSVFLPLLLVTLTTSGAYWVLSVASSSGCCLSLTCVYSTHQPFLLYLFFPIHCCLLILWRGFSLADIFTSNGFYLFLVISPLERTSVSYKSMNIP